jgi:hypothetical protein
MNENASISSTASILLSQAIGSSLVKNLGRLQGVVLGTVVGKLVWAITGWCTWWGYIALCISLFSWNFLCLYVYYDSPTYGGIACLLAAFGSGNFLVGCTDPITTPFDPAGPFYEIINVVCAIGIMIFVDMALAPGRANEMACETYADAFKAFRKALDELLDPRETHVRIKKGTIAGLIGGAKALGAEAFNEPRYWRAAWKNDLFNLACQTLTDLRVTMTAMEYSVTEGGVAGGPKTEIFMKILKSEHFMAIQNALYGKLDAMEMLGGLFSHDVAGVLMAETPQGREYEVMTEPSLQKDFKADMEVAIKEVLAEINSAISKEAAPTLETDQACQVSFCLSAFLMMLDQIQAFQTAAIQA